jgi:hypothetical protein
LARPYSIKSLCTVLRSWCDVGFKVRSLVKDFVYQLLAYSPSTDDSFGFQSCIMRSVTGILHWTYFDYTPRNSSRFSCRFFKPRDIFTEQDYQETITMATGEGAFDLCQTYEIKASKNQLVRVIGENFL